MKRCWHPVSPMPWWVRVALAERGLDQEDVVIDLPLRRLDRSSWLDRLSDRPAIQAAMAPSPG